MEPLLLDLNKVTQSSEEWGRQHVHALPSGGGRSQWRPHVGVLPLCRWKLFSSTFAVTGDKLAEVSRVR